MNCPPDAHFAQVEIAFFLRTCHLLQASPHLDVGVQTEVGDARLATALEQLDSIALPRSLVKFFLGHLGLSLLEHAASGRI